MAFLPKLFRHGQSNSNKLMEVKVVEGESPISGLSSDDSVQCGLIVNSGYIIRVIDGTTLSVVSLSGNYGFFHRIKERILQIIPNRERENFFIILCEMDVIHLVKINSTGSNGPNEVQRISSFKIENVTSVEWHPTHPQKFFTAGYQEISVWNLQRLNSLVLKDGSNTTEITSEMASRCCKTLSLVSLNEKLKLGQINSRKVKLLPIYGFMHDMPSNHVMIAIIDDEYALIIGETCESGDSISLSMQKCVNLSLKGISLQNVGKRLYFTYGNQLGVIVSDSLLIYQFDLVERSGMNNNINKVQGSNPSSDDELVSESEEEEEDVTIARINPTRVVKLPCIPLHYAVGSNLIYICSTTSTSQINSDRKHDASNTIMYYVELVDGNVIRPIKITRDNLPVEFEVLDMAISHPNANYLYFVIKGNNIEDVNNKKTPIADNDELIVQMTGKLLDIEYNTDEEWPNKCKMDVFRVDIGPLSKSKGKNLKNKLDVGDKSILEKVGEKAVVEKIPEKAILNKSILEKVGEKAILGKIPDKPTDKGAIERELLKMVQDRVSNEREAHTKGLAMPKSPIKVDLTNTARNERKIPVKVSNNESSSTSGAFTSGALTSNAGISNNASNNTGQIDIEMKIREMILNVIVPGINEALKVSLESMSLQILRYLTSKNGMYSEIIKRIDHVNDRINDVNERLGDIVERVGEITYKIDDMAKCVTVRIDSLEENIESANYELSAKYQSFDDKLLDLIEQKEYDKAFALASQMDLNTDSDFTLTLCEHFDTCTFFDNDQPPLTQLTLLYTCAALAHSTNQLETRINWIAECLALLDYGSGDFPNKKIPLMIPKISSYLESVKSYTHLRDKIRFASNVCSYLSKHTKHTSKGKHKGQHN